jgi:hypothetical protein
MGWVYAMVTPSMPGLVKLGATERDPSERLSEANAPDTWRPPEAYVVACATEVSNPFVVEHQVHAAFAARRVHPRREFFRATADEASTLIALIANVPHPQVPHEPTDTAHVAPAPPSRRSPVVAQTPECKLRAWVEKNFTHVPLREKDTGTTLEALYSSYTSAVPAVHAKVAGRNTFAKMLESTYVGIGPHRGSDGCKGIYLLR